MFNIDKSSILNYTFVFLQFGGMGLILLTGPFLATNTILLFIEIFGIILALWSIFATKLNNLSILPSLKEGAIFISHGPYKLIRHPMYLSILVTFTPLIINYFSFFRLCGLILILIDLLFKLTYEEKILTQNFPNYHSYKVKTYKLIPYFY